MDTGQQDTAALHALIDTLEAAGAFGAPGRATRRIETHISIVVLGEAYAWKFKKPVNLGFLDFSTLALRRAACEAELVLNRRLLPEYYLAVLPVAGPRETPRLGAEPAIEVCVQMRRFPAEAELAEALAAGRVTPAAMRQLGSELADFQAAIPRAPAAQAASCALAGHCAENFASLRGLAAAGGHRHALARLEHWTLAQLARHSGLLDRRQQLGRVRLGHGDLHAGNMLLLEGRIRIFDCVEFSEALRSLDVLDELAFALMDLQVRGHGALAAELLNGWLDASGDYAALPMLPLFLGYRAMVRAKVAAIEATAQADAAAEERLAAYLSLAQRIAAPRAGTLILTHGLSGSGKSTLAAGLVAAAGAVRIRSDVERRRLVAAAGEHGDRYSTAWTERTYARLAECCRAALAAGRPVIADATFLRAGERARFLALARDLGVALRILDCQAPEPVLRERIRARLAAARDPSEADLRVLEAQLAGREPLSSHERSLAVSIDTCRPPSPADLARALGLAPIA